MAQRRMFSPDIVKSDAFLEMPPSTQGLYFQLGMSADDDGFVNPKMVMRMMGSSEDEIRVLIAKRFVLPFENGVIVIKHWRMNNLVRKDWYKETVYSEQKRLLFVKQNGAYTFDSEQGSPLLLGENVVNESLTNRQRRLGKVRIGKDSIGKEKESVPDKILYGQFQRVKLTVDEYQSLLETLGEVALLSLITELDEYIESIGKDKYKNHRATIQTWARRKINSFVEKKKNSKPLMI